MSWQSFINSKRGPTSATTPIRSNNTLPQRNRPASPSSSLAPPLSKSSSLAPPQPSASSLTPPPSTNTTSSSTLFPAPNSAQRASASTISATAGAQKRQKVRLEPGHSPLDWAALKSSGKNLRGNIDHGSFPMKVNRSELKKHKSSEDCWTVLKGKVYNITPYLKFHPGGVPEIMKCAGTDGTFLFNKYHAWVNAERILDGCFVGFFVP